MLSSCETALGKQGPVRVTSEDRIKVALDLGLARDTSEFNDEPVHRKLAKLSETPYASMMDLWAAYSKEFPDADPQSLKSLKHFADTVALATKGKLDKEGGRPTVHTVRNKLRHFMAAWERQHTAIPKHIHDSVCAYIQTHLKDKLSLSTEKKKPTFLTIDNWVHMQTLLWGTDSHNYVHEGVRVCLAGLLNLHCYSSGRLKELCMARYKDIVCMVAWRTGEPEIKLGFTREFAKGMQDSHKKPQHSLYEQLTPVPPLFSHGLLFLLPVFLRSEAFREFKTIEDVLAARPRSGEQYCIMEWDDRVLMDPVFPVMHANGPTKKAKNPNSWGTQCSHWAIRAGFPQGMGLHAARREALIKVDDGGYSLGQVMKFAGHRSSKTLVGHYLDDMSNVDGAASFLGLEARRDVTEDFRSATMRRYPELPLSLPADMLAALRENSTYECLTKQIYQMNWQIKTDTATGARGELRSQMDKLYYQRRKLRDQLLSAHQLSQYRAYSTQREAQTDMDWRRTYFHEVVRHMVPERARLSFSLHLAVPLRSEHGISALRDLLVLLTNDSTVAYQESLRPTQGKCTTSSCKADMRSISVKDRWNHVYRCHLNALKQNHGFAEFCFPCNEWKTDAQDWEVHCQDHLNDNRIPWHCDPVIFRKGLALAGFCPCCLGNTALSATDRMRHYKYRSGWKRHYLECLSVYIEGQQGSNHIPCPHPRCDFVCSCKTSLQNHMEDSHIRTGHITGKKRQSQSDACLDIGDDDTSRAVQKRQRLSNGAAYNRGGSSTTIAPEMKSPLSSDSDSGMWGLSGSDSGGKSSSTLPDLNTRGSSPETTLPATPLFSAASDHLTESSDTAAGSTLPISSLEKLQSLTMSTIEQTPPLDLSSADAAPQADSETESDQEFEVEKILSKKKVGRQWKYLVKWKGYGSDDNTWEPIRNLGNCSQKLKAFEEEGLL